MSKVPYRDRTLLWRWSLKALLAATFLCCTTLVRSQTCTATFTYVNNGNGNFTFSNTATPNNTFSSFSWVFSGGTPSTSTSNNTVNVTFPSNGTYTAVLTNSTSSPGCNTTGIIVFTVTGVCNLSAGFTTSLGPNGLAVFTSTGSGITNYSWQANTSGTNSVLVTTYTANGVYPVSLVVSSGTCQDSLMDTVVINNICNLNANAGYTTGPAGQVQFLNSTTGTATPTSYTWSFGNGNTSGQYSPLYTYTANGSYVVTLTARNDSIANCVDTHTMFVVVSNIVCNADFTYSVLPNGVVSFTSTSQPATSSSQYTWSFAGGATYTAIGNTTAVTSYSANGNYTVSLSFISGNCFQTVTHTVVVNTIIPCNLFADFTYSEGPNGVVNFTNTTLGISGPTAFSWDFGDTFGSSAFSPVHTFSANGAYQVYLYVQDSTHCKDTTMQTVFVTSYTCALVASFSHTVGSNGAVTYSSTSTPTQSSQLFRWDFGDGYSATGQPIVHTYQNGGTHYVTLIITDSLNLTCDDTIVQAVNITGISCSANAGFTLSPTSTPHYWTATPAYPWNIMAASWSWADGSHSDSLYTSHTYSASGQYYICLTVTASCGSTATACSSYSLSKSSGAFVHVNVMPPAVTGVSEAAAIERAKIILYPVPASETLHIRLENATVNNQLLIIDARGRCIYNSFVDPGSTTYESTLDISAFAEGIYICQLKGAGPPVSLKFLVTR